MNKLNFLSKVNGDTLEASEWNSVVNKVDEIVESVNEGGSAGTGNVAVGGTDNNSHIYLNAKGNLCVETTIDNVPSGKKGKINIESKDDILIKPGDDLSIHSHHRAEGDKDLVSLKILTETNDETEIPARLKLNTGDITVTNKDNIVAIMVEIKSTYKKTPDYTIDTDLTENTFTSGNIYTQTEIETKLDQLTTDKATIIASILEQGIGKTKVLKYTDGTTNTFYKFTKVSNADGVTNVSIEDSKGYGYLKVRAQSIDLRCEEHGGIALQPKGYDSDGNMNKIKFEHGGGDGLEFATFNTEKTSIFTNEYRFNKNGVWKMATRQTTSSGKTPSGEGTIPQGGTATSISKYVKQADDFYDIINPNDPQCTTLDIIKTVNTFNNNYITTQCISNFSTSKKNGLLISGDVGIRILNYDWNQIDNNIKQNPALEDIVRIDSTTPQLKLTWDTFIQDFPINKFFSFSEFNAFVNQKAYYGLSDLYNYISSQNIGDKVIIQFANAYDNATVGLYFEIIPYDIFFTTVNLRSNLHNVGDFSWPEESVSVSDLIKLVNWMKTNHEGPWTPQT